MLLISGTAISMGKSEYHSPGRHRKKPLAYLPGEDGHLGGWLYRALPPETVETSIPSSIGSLGGADWKPLISKNAWVMLDRSGKEDRALLALVIRSPKKQNLLFSLGTDDGANVWLNTKCISRSSVERGAAIDTDLIPLKIKEGDNLLVLELSRYKRGYFRVVARVLNHDFARAKDIRIVLPGVSKSAHESLMSFGQYCVEKQIDLEKRTAHFRIALQFKAGIPFGIQEPINVEWGQTQTQHLLVLEEGQTSHGEVVFDKTVDTTREKIPERVSIDSAGTSQIFELGFSSNHIGELADAGQKLANAKGSISQATLDSLLWRVQHLKMFLEGDTVDREYVSLEIETTATMAEHIAQRRDPYLDASGIVKMGYRSSVDGNLHGYVLYVPREFDEKKDEKWGLVVTLHGYLGTAMKAMLAVFGKPLPEGVEPRFRERHPPPIDDVPFFVVAPEGFGASGYRGFGEVDVVEVIEEVARRFTLDPDRVYITGTSMGGYGAAALALHFPDVFAAAAPLGGYHNGFLYRRARDCPLGPWESFLVSEFSNRDWAENGAATPMYIVHGKKDAPKYSRSLVTRYEELGYGVQFETPNLGHNVWDLTYQNGKIFTYFAGHKRKRHPRKVSFNTARLRYRKSDWIILSDVCAYDAWARVDAHWKKDNTIEIETRNVKEIVVLDDETLRRGKDVTVIVDDEIVGTFGSDAMWTVDTLDLEVRVERHLHRQGLFFHRDDDGRWYPGAMKRCDGLCKEPGRSGPLDDVFFGPVLFVYGTSDPRETHMSKRMAEKLRKPRFSVSVDWPLKADGEVTEDDMAKYSLVLVGTPSGNSLVGEMMEHLPIQVVDDAIVVGTKRFTGQSVAASFIYPNPLMPSRYVVIHTGVSDSALYYVDHLPRFSPDYLVYDGGDWHSKDGRFFGGRAVLAGGFFDADWSVSPENTTRDMCVSGND